MPVCLACSRLENLRSLHSLMWVAGGLQRAEAELGITAKLILCFMTELSPEEASKTLEQVS